MPRSIFRRDWSSHQMCKFWQKNWILGKKLHLIKSSISSRNWCTYRINILRPFLESSGSIFCNFMKNLKFGPFCIPNGNHETPSILQDLQKKYYRFCSKKAWKIAFCWCNYLFRKIHIETFQKPFRPCFNHYFQRFYPLIIKELWFWPKLSFLPKIAHLMRTSTSSKNWSRHRINVLRPFLESLGSIFSNSMKIFEI